MNFYENSLSFAMSCDQQDSLKPFRELFIFPQHNEKNALYFCGNSLGLLSKPVQKAIEEEVARWGKYGVEGHFGGDSPWYYNHKPLMPLLAKVVGAKTHEVIPMNLLTVNLHLLLVSFYQPTSQRYKIITESGAFPSDNYVLETHLKFRGINPESAVIEIEPRKGEHILRTEDILQTIQQHGNELALIMMGGINYYTGQLFDMKAITAAAHQVGALAGFDLAHAAGNVALHLHDWDVDFAAWCSYKYLNSSPGGVAGIFIHEKYAERYDLPRLGGWWGYDEQERFQMKKGFKPMYGAEGWQLSNSPVLLNAAHLASLQLFEQATMEKLTVKSKQLTGFLLFILQEIQKKTKNKVVEIITPLSENERGAQLSLFIHQNGKQLFEQLSQEGVICDWREPNVMRLAPAPLYNSFQDVYELGQLLEKYLLKQ
jgi:kynureninase